MPVRSSIAWTPLSRNWLAELFHEIVFLSDTTFHSCCFSQASDTPKRRCQPAWSPKSWIKDAIPLPSQKRTTHCERSCVDQLNFRGSRRVEAPSDEKLRISFILPFAESALTYAPDFEMSITILRPVTAM